MRITGRIAKLETWSHRAQRHQHEAETRALFQILVPHGDARRALRTHRARRRGGPPNTTFIVSCVYMISEKASDVIIESAMADRSEAEPARSGKPS